MRHLKLTVPLLAGLAVPAVQAGPAYLVDDINFVQVNAGSLPAEMVYAGRYAYFTAEDDLHGRELWRTDGTPQGAELVVDVRPGPADSSPHHLVYGDGLIFFVAYQDVSGWGLWKSDGTRDGTTLIRPFPGVASFSTPVTWMQVFRGRLLFSARDVFGEHELWTASTDGSKPEKVDLCPGECSGFPGTPRQLGDALYFSAVEPVSGQELWTTDGTPQGTSRFTDICPGECDGLNYFAFIGDMKELAGELFFTADDGDHGSELWKTDGTGQGTVMVKDLRDGTSSAPRGFVAHGDHVYFTTAGSGQDERTWRSDGTEEGTEPAAELLPHGSEHVPRQLFESTSGLFFSFQKDDQVELWVHDGTTRLIRSGFDAAWYAARLGGRVLLRAGSDSEPLGLWASDGTTEGTRRLTDFDVASLTLLPLFDFNDRLLFAGDDGSTGPELWVTDATPEGTALLSDLRPLHTSARPRELTPLGDRLFLAASEGFGGEPLNRLWASDGTEAGTLRLDALAEPRELVAALDQLFFVNDASHTLWAYGVDLGVRELSGADFPEELLSAGDLLFYRRYPAGQQVWRSDGTAAGTFLLRDVNPDWYSGCVILCPGPPPTFPAAMTPVGAKLFFIAFEEDLYQLWASDGTTAGTGVVRTFDFGYSERPDFGALAEGSALGENLILAVDDATGGPSLWKSDGTSEGTWPYVKGLPGLTTRQLVAAGADVFFVLADFDGDRLWATDGTATGTREVPLPPGARIGETVAVGDRLFFSLAEDATGTELWVSDGTAEGTTRVRDIRPGPAGSSPSSLAETHGWLVFAADDGETGLEVWMSNGTEEGTFRVDDLLPGTAASGPEGFATVGSRIFFAGDDGVHGRELFAFDAADVPELAPVADFEGTSLVGFAPHTVELTNRSTGYVSKVQWDFGDGETAATRDATHTYKKPGVYDVTLTVRSTAGDDSITRARFVVVWPDLVARKKP